jgi:hypothetical protein
MASTRADSGERVRASQSASGVETTSKMALVSAAS